MSSCGGLDRERALIAFAQFWALVQGCRCQKYSVDASPRTLYVTRSISRLYISRPINPKISSLSSSDRPRYMQISIFCHANPHRNGSLTVDAQLAMPNHLLNLSLLLQILQRLPCQTSIDLETIDERGDGYEAI